MIEVQIELGRKDVRSMRVSENQHPAERNLNTIKRMMVSMRSRLRRMRSANLVEGMRAWCVAETIYSRSRCTERACNLSKPCRVAIGFDRAKECAASDLTDAQSIEFARTDRAFTLIPAG